MNPLRKFLDALDDDNVMIPVVSLGALAALTALPFAMSEEDAFPWMRNKTPEAANTKAPRETFLVVSKRGNGTVKATSCDVVQKTPTLIIKCPAF